MLQLNHIFFMDIVVFIGFTSHQHRKGYMATFQYYWWRKTFEGTPPCIISGTSGLLNRNTDVRYEYCIIVMIQDLLNIKCIISLCIGNSMKINNVHRCFIQGTDSRVYIVMKKLCINIFTDYECFCFFLFFFSFLSSFFHIFIT